MTLQHDGQGFLVGTKIDLESLDPALKQWAVIARDVRAIRQQLAKMAEGAVRKLPSSSPRAPAIPRPRRANDERARDARGRFVRATSAVDVHVTAPAPEQIALPRARADTVRAREHAQSAIRDRKGRFTGDDAREHQHDGDDTGAQRLLANSTGKLAQSATALKDVALDFQETDPAIKAMSEVAQPLQRGWQAVSGLIGIGGDEDKKQNRWLRRIWRSLTGKHKDDAAFQKIAKRRLKAIEERPDPEEKGGGLGGLLMAMLAGLGGLLSRIPVIGPLLTRGLARLLPAAGMAGMAGAGRRGATPVPGGKPGTAPTGKPAGKPGMLSRAGRMAGRVGRRIPVIGPLLALGLGALDAQAIERDESTSREQKNAAQGRNWGSVTGGLGGALAGGTAGAAIGSVVPVVGTAIGGVVGAIVGGLFGDWLGGEGGQWIGENFSKISDTASDVFSEIKAVALGTWDWAKGCIEDGWNRAVAVFSKVADTIGTLWDGVVDSAKAGFERFTGLFGAAYEGLKNLPVIGTAITAAENAAKRARERVVSTASKAVEITSSVARKAVEVTASVARQAWDAAKTGVSALVPQELKDSVAARRAIETGNQWREGTIAGLDDAHTRALVASVAETESHGGQLDVRNLGGKGYAGRYQAGAAWLADAGYIQGGAAAVKAAMQADGVRSEWAWAQSGGMDRFLKNDANWNNGLSLSQYLSSAELQDRAFKTNSDIAYRDLVKRGLITDSTSQDDIAGLLKARHIGGIGAAVQVARGGTGVADANGTTARKYFEDMTQGTGQVYARAFSGIQHVTEPAMPAAPLLPVQAPMAPVQAPVQVSVSAPKIPSLPAIPSVPAAPNINIPLPSSAPTRVIVANTPGEPGQDVRDRDIAHIVTGGYAG